MKYVITKKTSCESSNLIGVLSNSSDKSILCADNIRTKIEGEFNCKLMSRNETDIINGYISILHTPNNHLITVEFYDKDEKPNNVHTSTFKKLSTIPTESEIKKAIK